MANNLDRPERRRQNGSLSLNMRPFSFNFSAQCWGSPQQIYWDFLFLVGFLIEERNVLFLKTSVVQQNYFRKASWKFAGAGNLA